VLGSLFVFMFGSELRSSVFTVRARVQGTAASSHHGPNLNTNREV